MKRKRDVRDSDGRIDDADRPPAGFVNAAKEQGTRNLTRHWLSVRSRVRTKSQQQLQLRQRKVRIGRSWEEYPSARLN
ncbi:MAG: hypothetical protein KDD69_16220, partial [Bdellovibrionales bacterium]|nr:hypothetical protein [Bdellovibrionales bacterium]